MPKKKDRYIRPDGLIEKQKTINGKRKVFRGYTEAEIEDKMIAYQGEVIRGRKFSVVADEWKGLHFPTLSYTTQRGYNPSYNRAVDELGDRPIKQIKASDIKEHLNALNAQRSSQKTIRTQLLVYSLIFSYAAEIGEIDISVAQNVTMPKHIQPPNRRDAASTTDEEIIKESVGKWLLPYFLLYTGMRRGEALAIQFKDIDRKEGSIFISKSVYFELNKPRIKCPKTEAGIRTIPILEPLLKHLPKGKPDCYLFSIDGGITPLTKAVYDKRWERFVKETGITCTAHQLRHSFASLLFDADIGAKDAQKLLGHSTEAVTRDIYTHIRDSRQQKTTTKLNAYIKAQGKNTPGE